jgi:TRAP transporter TAXI family solute receptor
MSRSRAQATWIAVARSLAVAAVLLCCMPTARAEDRGYFRIGTAGTAGTYFRFGGLIATAISSPSGTPNCARGGICGVPGLIAVAQATQGSVENVELIGKSQLESALAQADVASWAYSGAGIFKGKPIAELRAIAALYPESVHIIVRADGPIQSLRDLKGKRVSLGEKESGTLAEVRILLDMVGLSERDLRPDYSRLADAANGLREGSLDAFFLVGGYPVPAITDLAGSTPIRLLPIGTELFEKLRKRYPYFSRSDIPGGTYAGVDAETSTAGVNALWIVDAGIPDDLVYAITKSLWSDATQQILTTRHPMTQRLDLEHALDGIDIPLHPGAERYYRERGVAIPVAKAQ